MSMWPLGPLLRHVQLQGLEGTRSRAPATAMEGAWGCGDMFGIQGTGFHNYKYIWSQILSISTATSRRSTPNSYAHLFRTPHHPGKMPSALRIGASARCRRSSGLKEEASDADKKNRTQGEDILIPGTFLNQVVLESLAKNLDGPQATKRLASWLEGFTRSSCRVVMGFICDYLTAERRKNLFKKSVLLDGFKSAKDYNA